MSFSHISSPVRHLTSRNVTRKYITLGKVIGFWADIVGPELAAKTCPIGMSVRKTGGGQQAKNGRNLEAVLEISATSAEATLLHYQKNLILERLKQALGDTIVVDIKVTHGGARLNTTLPPAPPPLTAQGKTCLSMGIDGVTDPELRAALENLGRWIET